MFKTFVFIVAWLLPKVVFAQTILVLGDSLSAAYGLPDVDRGWVSLLQQRLSAAGDRVINASIPGDTTAGGLERLTPLLEKHRPGWVLVELGANDGLRALSPAQMKTNLSAIVKQSRAAGAGVILLGMRLPPNYGRRYEEAFEAVFPGVATEAGIPLVPFFMEGVGGQAQYLQTDGLHPNEAAQPLMLENVWRIAAAFLTKAPPP